MAARTFVEYQRDHKLTYEQCNMVEEVWKLATMAAIDAMEAQNTCAQQLKPKMPSYIEVENEYKLWWKTQGFFDYPDLSIRKIYDIIARHFGH